VICGRASAYSLDPAGATLESPLDSSKHIIAQLLCRAPLPDAGVPAIASFCPLIRVLSANAGQQQLTSGLAVIQTQGQWRIEASATLDSTT
jgi:hypothetical protein